MQKMAVVNAVRLELGALTYRTVGRHVAKTRFLAGKYAPVLVGDRIRCYLEESELEVLLGELRDSGDEDAAFVAGRIESAQGAGPEVARVVEEGGRFVAEAIA